ncbi:hypothetical protein BHE74_00051201 [Ensete ventricosum]|nr:hypothetical protein GW17_00002750 [Ensete ventricosum]RWW43168.1 hypothetical protein BHE74_00051201 [Ensete ventricosum]RZS06239.1 hypothetical protein BHM03_00036864 [Ensete ventricosum]
MPLDRATLASSGRSVDPSPLSFPSSDPPSEYSWAEEYQRLYPRWKSFDAARLDVEMSAMLKEQLVKVFSLMKLELGLKDLGFLFPKRYGIALPQLVGNIYGPVSNHSQLFADGVILNRDHWHANPGFCYNASRDYIKLPLSSTYLYFFILEGKVLGLFCVKIFRICLNKLDCPLCT